MLKPLADRVVLEVKEVEEKTVGGFVLAGSAGKETPQMAEVVAVGPGKNHHGTIITPSVKVGDTVVFDKYAGTEVKDGDSEFLIVREKDILAVVE